MKNPIAAHVLKHGIRNIDLAVGMGISPGTAHDIVNGNQGIGPKTAQRFAKFIGAPKRWRDYLPEPEDA